VRPPQTTTYVVATSDGTTTRHDTTEFRITGAATAFAGNDTTVCWFTAPIPINATATNYTRFLWGSTGDGLFTDPNSLTTFYVPGMKDKTKGSVDLKLIVWPLAPCLDKASDLLHIVLDPCTGINETSGGEWLVEIQPNPVKEKATLKISGLKSRAAFSVAALDGRILMRGTVDPQGGTYVTRDLEVTSFAKGIYLLKLDDGNKTAITRFVVN
jgi:hypothetical protein